MEDGREKENKNGLDVVAYEEQYRDYRDNGKENRGETGGRNN